MAMKYIKPETKTYKIELQLLNPDSFVKDNSEDNKVTDEIEVLGRDFSFGFFEEEEEE